MHVAKQDKFCLKKNFRLDIKDYLTCDLKLSDTAFNDFFSEFDINTNDFQCFDPSTNTTTTYLQQAPIELPPPPYDATILSTSSEKITPNSNVQMMEAPLEEYMSTGTLQTLIEQHQVQQSAVKYSSSPSPSSVPVRRP